MNSKLKKIQEEAKAIVDAQNTRTETKVRILETDKRVDDLIQVEVNGRQLAVTIKEDWQDALRKQVVRFGNKPTDPVDGDKAANAERV